jgi:hypothetical protein
MALQNYLKTLSFPSFAWYGQDKTRRDEQQLFELRAEVLPGLVHGVEEGCGEAVARC